MLVIRGFINISCIYACTCACSHDRIVEKTGDVAAAFSYPLLPRANCNGCKRLIGSFYLSGCVCICNVPHAGGLQCFHVTLSPCLPWTPGSLPSASGSHRLARAPCAAFFTCKLMGSVITEEIKVLDHPMLFLPYYSHFLRLLLCQRVQSTVCAWPEWHHKSLPALLPATCRTRDSLLLMPCFRHRLSQPLTK